MIFAGDDYVEVTDITYLPTAAGFVYLAVVLDLFSRKMSVGCSRKAWPHRCSARRCDMRLIYKLAVISSRRFCIYDVFDLVLPHADPPMLILEQIAPAVDAEWFKESKIP